MTKQDWYTILEKDPENYEAREMFARWLIDDAPPVECETCEGRGRANKFMRAVGWYQGKTIPSEVIITCPSCDGTGVTEKPNLLLAATQRWMTERGRTPRYYNSSSIVDQTPSWDWVCFGYDPKAYSKYEHHLDRALFELFPFELRQYYHRIEFRTLAEAEWALCQTLTKVGELSLNSER